ncbi:MAG: hypothetical protein IPP88_14090 [Betaproteobacteria bacterium]|nr:hypothetical protein [Betaproteobacteria bacterium]
MTLLSIFLLLYLNFKRITETLIVMLSVPFALIGRGCVVVDVGFELQPLSSSAVGFIALLGVAADTVVCADLPRSPLWEAVKEKAGVAGRTMSVTNLYEAVMEGAIERVRPNIFFFWVVGWWPDDRWWQSWRRPPPIVWGTGAGSEVMSLSRRPWVRRH